MKAAKKRPRIKNSLFRGLKRFCLTFRVKKYQIRKGPLQYDNPWAGIKATIVKWPDDEEWGESIKDGLGENNGSADDTTGTMDS